MTAAANTGGCTPNCGVSLRSAYGSPVLKHTRVSCLLRAAVGAGDLRVVDQRRVVLSPGDLGVCEFGPGRVAGAGGVAEDALRRCCCGCPAGAPSRCRNVRFPDPSTYSSPSSVSAVSCSRFMTVSPSEVACTVVSPVVIARAVGDQPAASRIRLTRAPESSPAPTGDDQRGQRHVGEHLERVGGL